MSKPTASIKSSHCSYVSPEDVERQQFYAFTLNPCDRFQFVKFKDTDRFSNFKYSMISIMQKFFTCDYRFWIEMSNKGRLHLHGKVKFTDNMQILHFYNFLHRCENLGLMTFMFSNIGEALSDQKKKIYKNWTTYCKKQMDFWSKIGCNSQIFKSVVYTVDSRYDITKYFE